MIDGKFWKGKKVFITGHTGFKGSWLSLWLHRHGANVTGYSLKPPTTPSLFKLGRIDRLVTSVTGDVRDRQTLLKAFSKAKPEVVLHLAAQPIVRDSYKAPFDTYEINVMGTVNILETIRLHGGNVRVFVNITTDKVYENREWAWGYRENEPFGGYDPYSNSKACSELVTAAYRSSYFNPSDYRRHKTAVATARAGNVIGGGDWATDRIIPDCMRSILSNKPIVVRNPHAVRPWQHVLEPLHGYLLLAEKLWLDGPGYSEAWNFGPSDEGCRTVHCIVKTLCEQWGHQARFSTPKVKGPHEANFLKLDCSKSRARLGWNPLWNIEETVKKIVEWYRALQARENISAICLKQICEFEATK